MLLFCLNTTIYLSPQLLVYMPIDLPVHYPTCSFWLFHSDKPFVLTCPLACCSKYSQIYLFLNQPVQFVCVFHMALHAHLSVNSSAGLPTDRPTRKWMYLLILMQLDTQTYLSTYRPVYIPTDHVHLDPSFPVNQEDLPLHSPPSPKILLL